MATQNTLTVLRLKTPFTYIVQSVKNLDYTSASHYTVNTNKMTCDCPHGEHTQGISAKPCKHIVFCKNIEQESILKNYVHFNLALKGIKVAKVLKITRIVKAGIKTKIVAASYITNHGKKACCFLNIVDMRKERFFEIYDNQPNVGGGRTLRVSVSDQIITSQRYMLGYQFDLVFDNGGYTKHAYGDIGAYIGVKSVDIYEAMTTIVLPMPMYHDGYMDYIRQARSAIARKDANFFNLEQNNWIYDHNGINLYYITGFHMDTVIKKAAWQATKTITWESQKEVTEYKKVATDEVQSVATGA